LLSSSSSLLEIETENVSEQAKKKQEFYFVIDICSFASHLFVLLGWAERHRRFFARDSNGSHNVTLGAAPSHRDLDHPAS
jgi:hypothetical protein